MFYLRRGHPREASKDEFGWWLSDSFDDEETGDDEDTSISESSVSPRCCLTNPEEKLTAEKEEENDKEEEMKRSLRSRLDIPGLDEELDVELIEMDAIKDTDAERSRATSYTPERLVRCQEYRIVVPPPRYLSVFPKVSVELPENKGRRKRGCRRRLGYQARQLSNTSQSLFSPHPSSSSSNSPTHWKRVNDHQERCTATKSRAPEKMSIDLSSEMSTDFSHSTLLFTPDSMSKRSSYDRLNATWDSEARASSLEDTSGIQSNWSSDQSDLHNSTGPQCLCDELASTNFTPNFSQDRVTAINEVVSILEVLETDPGRAALLLEDDLCGSNSSHDQRTRLALTIENDASIPVDEDHPEQLTKKLQRKVEKLRIGNQDIFRDVCSLRKRFQCDERKTLEISAGVCKLRRELRETRYLDELLVILQGELERVSRQRWPFVLGHADEHCDELNLII